METIHWKKGGLVGTGAFSSCFEAMDFKSGRIMAVKQVSQVMISMEVLVCEKSENQYKGVAERSSLFASEIFPAISPIPEEPFTFLSKYENNK